MRLIEKEMCQALRNEWDWRKDNTRVRWSANPSVKGKYAEVYLHGNLIAVYNPWVSELTILDGGWQSVTTKSRLNALINEFVGPREGVFQRDWVWYYTNLDGESVRWTGDHTYPTTS